MGLGSYFKADKPQPPTSEPAPKALPGRKSSNARSAPPPRLTDSAMSEKPPSERSTNRPDSELHPPTPRYGSRPQSISGRSVRSTGSSMFLDDIKHEVMVNYLYQQQCSHLWVSDGSGEIEGVLLRKSRGQYMACPPQLGNSPFALACAALNVQVSFF